MNNVLKIIFKLLSYVILTLFFPTIVNAAPTSSLYLDELDTTSTYTVSDSQNNYDGTAHQAPSMGSGLGKICSAIDLRASGTSDYITLDKNSLSGAGDFTISVWNKMSSTAGRSLLSGARSGRDNEIIMWFTDGNKFNGYIDGTPTSALTIGNIADDKWHHLVWRRAGDQSCFFVDGVQKGCNTVKTKTLSIESLILGQEQDNVGGAFSASQDWEGIVDEFLTFKTALSNSDITSIYNNQKANKSWNGQKRTCPVPPADNDYSDWHFDEITYDGTTDEVVDSHGGFHGTGHSVSTVTAGKVCNALDLRTNSASDYINLGAGALNGVDDFTISVWHKGTSSASRAILSGANSTAGNELLYWFSNSTTFRGHLKNSDLTPVSVSSINDGNWHHFAWIRKGTESCFYKDAVFQACQTEYTSQRLSIQGLIVGQDQDSVGGTFDAGQDWEALLDELIIFKRAFSSSEISSIYNNQNAGKNWDGGTRVCPRPSMSLKKTSAVISDPVNLTNNPKRIPGSIIRYTLTASNTNSIPANDIVINDDLTNSLSQGLSWHGNMKIKSPNVNSGNVKSLTDATGDDEGEFNNNKITARCGDIDSSAPCILTYDVEVTN